MKRNRYTSRMAFLFIEDVSSCRSDFMPSISSNKSVKFRVFHCSLVLICKNRKYFHYIQVKNNRNISKNLCQLPIHKLLNSDFAFDTEENREWKFLFFDCSLQGNIERTSLSIILAISTGWWRYYSWLSSRAGGWNRVLIYGVFHRQE